MKESDERVLQAFFKSLGWPVFLLLLVLTGVAGCQSIKSSEPIIPIAEYERMLVGRLDADYVGTKNCLSACHYHDQVSLDFEASTMGAQMSEDSDFPLVDCESCHGPGSLAIEGLTPEKVAGQTTYLEELLDNFKVDEDANDSYMVGKQPGGGKQQLLETE